MINLENLRNLLEKKNKGTIARRAYDAAMHVAPKDETQITHARKDAIRKNIIDEQPSFPETNNDPQNKNEKKDNIKKNEKKKDANGLPTPDSDAGNEPVKLGQETEVDTEPTTNDALSSDNLAGQYEKSLKRESASSHAEAAAGAILLANQLKAPVHILKGPKDHSWISQSDWGKKSKEFNELGYSAVSTIHPSKAKEVPIDLHHYNNDKINEVSKEKLYNYYVDAVNDIAFHNKQMHNADNLWVQRVHEIMKAKRWVGVRNAESKIMGKKSTRVHATEEAKPETVTDKINDLSNHPVVKDYWKKWKSEIDSRAEQKKELLGILRGEEPKKEEAQNEGNITNVALGIAGNLVLRHLFKKRMKEVKKEETMNEEFTFHHGGRTGGEGDIVPINPKDIHKKLGTSGQHFELTDGRYSDTHTIKHSSGKAWSIYSNRGSLRIRPRGHNDTHLTNKLKNYLEEEITNKKPTLQSRKPKKLPNSGPVSNEEHSTLIEKHWDKAAYKKFWAADPDTGNRIRELGKKWRAEYKGFKSGKAEIKRLKARNEEVETKSEKALVQRHLKHDAKYHNLELQGKKKEASKEYKKSMKAEREIDRLAEVHSINQLRQAYGHHLTKSHEFSKLAADLADSGSSEWRPFQRTANQHEKAEKAALKLIHKKEKKLTKEEIKEGDSNPPLSINQRHQRKTTNYLYKRDDDIAKRIKQGHSNDKIAKDTKYHPAAISAVRGSMSESHNIKQLKQKAKEHNTASHDAAVSAVRAIFVNGPHSSEHRTAARRAEQHLKASGIAHRLQHKKEADDRDARLKSYYDSIKKEEQNIIEARSHYNVIDKYHAIGPWKGDRYELHANSIGRKNQYTGKDMEWHSIIKTHQGGQSTKNEYGGYSPRHVGAPKYIARKWKQLKNSLEDRKISPMNKSWNEENLTELKTPNQLQKDVLKDPDKYIDDAVRINRMMGKHTKIIQKLRAAKKQKIEEISKDKLEKYIVAADKDVQRHDRSAKITTSNWAKQAHRMIADKRIKGIRKAFDKLDEMARHSLGGGKKGSSGSKGQDTEGDDHIINQLRKAKDLGSYKVTFADKSSHEIHRDHATHALQLYSASDKPAHKETMMQRLGHSHQSFHDVLSGKPHQTTHKSKISLGGSRLVGGVQ